MTIDFVARTIVLSKKEMTAACRYGSDELPVAYNYNQMKVWFLGKYEEIAKFYENIA